MKTMKISDETHRLLTMVKGELMAITGEPNMTYDDAIYQMVKYWREESTEKERFLAQLKPYHHVRFRWWNRVDLEEVAKELGETFSVEWTAGPSAETEIDVRKAEREVLKVKADTLGAFLDIYKAVLYQTEPAPFTTRDQRLRNKLFELYAKNRPTPFPWEYLKEPKFVVTEESQVESKKDSKSK